MEQGFWALFLCTVPGSSIYYCGLRKVFLSNNFPKLYPMHEDLQCHCKLRCNVEESDLTTEQLMEMRLLIEEAEKFEQGQHLESPKRPPRLTDEDFRDLFDLKNYEITEEETRKIKNADKTKIFNNIQWISQNLDKVDEEIKKSIGLHVWAILHWKEILGKRELKKFLFANDYDLSFLFFLNKQFGI